MILFFRAMFNMAALVILLTPGPTPGGLVGVACAWLGYELAAIAEEVGA